MAALGAPFAVLSGGVKVTAVTRGALADAQTIRAMAALAGELARGGARSWRQTQVQSIIGAAESE